MTNITAIGNFVYGIPVSVNLEETLNPQIRKPLLLWF